MSTFRVIYVVDGTVRRWWEVADVDTSELRRKFDGLVGTTAQPFDVRVSSQDGVVLDEDGQILTIQPGTEFRLVGRDEFMPPLGSQVD